MAIYQIYYNNRQLNKLQFKPYYNDDLTYYFENSVIIDLYNKGLCKGNYFAVLSPIFFDKVKNMNRRNIDKNYIERALKVYNPDVLNPIKLSNFDYLKQAEAAHPNIIKYIYTVCEAIGLRIDTKLKNLFISNYQICRPHIYAEYIETVLIPAINVMDTMPELMQSANYNKPLPEKVVNRWGFNHYTYHTFICERLFTLWINQKKINIKVF